MVFHMAHNLFFKRYSRPMSVGKPLACVKSHMGQYGWQLSAEMRHVGGTV